MSQKLSVGGVKWVENTSQFSKVLQKTTMKIAKKNIFLKLMVTILKNYMIFAITYILLQKNMLYTQEI